MCGIGRYQNDGMFLGLLYTGPRAGDMDVDKMAQSAKLRMIAKRLVDEVFEEDSL